MLIYLQKKSNSSLTSHSCVRCSPNSLNGASVTIGDAIERSKEEIITTWETQVRRFCPAAQNKGKIALRDDLPELLDELAKTLDTTDPDPGCIEDPAKKHGIQRAYFPDYSIAQVLTEYSILRRVLVSTLKEKMTLSHELQSRIHQNIDESIVTSSIQFSKVRETQISELLANLERSNRDLSHFAAIAAHDLRSPIATISSYVSYLDELLNDKSTETKESLDFISAATRRIMILIEKLLDYAHLRKGSLIIQDVDLNEAFTNAISNLEALIDETNTKFFHRNLPTVRGDLTILTQLFQNLFSNSIKFRGDEPPIIRVSLAEENNDFWTIAVGDNGIGFDQKHESVIFEPFKRLHVGEDYQGSGLGLATCNRVAELHGGKMWVTSKINEGSTFYFSISKRL